MILKLCIPVKKSDYLKSFVSQKCAFCLLANTDSRGVKMWEDSWIERLMIAVWSLMSWSVSSLFSPMAPSLPSAKAIYGLEVYLADVADVEMSREDDMHPSWVSRISALSRNILRSRARYSSKALPSLTSSSGAMTCRSLMMAILTGCMGCQLAILVRQPPPSIRGGGCDQFSR